MLKKVFKPINWNRVEDKLDAEVWDRLTANFWLPEAIPLSQDLNSWRNLTAEEKDVVKKTFAGLTLLDTIQGAVGATSLEEDAVTPHEGAVYKNIGFMEMVHAKSYSSIFSTLCSTEEIDDIMEWASTDPIMQKKAEIVESYYVEEDSKKSDPFKKKIASTILESFLFYSGFYTPMYLASKGKLNNTATVIKLILRDEAIHGFYIGAKYQKQVQQLSEEEQNYYRDFTLDLIIDLYQNEVEYVHNLYDQVGWSEDVTQFLRYNANKALMNLGYDAMFPEVNVRPEVLTAIAPDNENHDFFSQKSSTYIIGAVEDMGDDDWDF